jgi:hypothetical protein
MPSPTWATTRAENIEACEVAGITPYVARPQRGAAVFEGRFAKDEFAYDATDDFYRCPAGHRLAPVRQSEKDGHRSIHYSNRRVCRDCPLKSQCTGASFRYISRWEGEAVLDRMTQRLAARPGILNVRRETVEHPFGSIKQWMNQGAFLMKGLEKVRGEFSLTAFAYNLKRAITILGVPALMKAVRA